MQQNGLGGTSGAHTTCCEERLVPLQVLSLAPGAFPGAFLAGSQCLLSAQTSWLCQVHIAANRLQENLHF